MISEEKVSVIMSVYNEKNIYLENSINSILNQSYKNIEFIIVLDNPDNKEAEKTILRFMNHDKRIIFIKNSYNIGLTKSLNKALNKISGDYVCRMDADDISYSKRIEWQINHIKAYDIDLLGGGKDDIDENGNIVNKFKYVPNGIDKVRKLLEISNVIYHPTWMVKKKVYDDLNGYRDIHTAEDYDLLLRALQKGYKIDNLNRCIISYRLTNNSISRGNALKQFLVSECLKKNYKYKYDKIDIDEYVCKRINNHNIKKYNVGNVYINELFTLIRKKIYWYYKMHNKYFN